jgi:hypothetical protein
MTEKRFTWIKNTSNKFGIIIDNKTEKDMMGTKETCKFMNKQEMMIESQEKQLQKQYRVIKEQDQRIKELEKENILLKNQKTSIFDDKYCEYYSKGYTGETIEDIRFRERTEQALQRVEKSDNKGKSVDEFIKELEKW